MKRNAASLPSFLAENPSVKFVRLQYVDLSGIIRTRIVTIQHCLELVTEGQFAKVGGKAMLYSVTDKTSSITPAFGLCELRPDWDSLRLCTYAPGHASVMCCVYDTRANDPFHLCPRMKLANFLADCEELHKKTFLVGFEIEFVFLDAFGEPPQSIDRIAAWTTTSGLRGKTLNLVEDVVEALQASGTPVLHFHTVEPHQLQIATGPSNPLKAIDGLMHTHECLKHVSAQYGLRVTMVPKPIREELHSGAHGHVSIHPPDGDQFFLAGMLENLEALCSFGMPTLDSYTRVTGLSNAAGTWITWGSENRYVPIREIHKGRWELRYIDATANFYLVWLATLGAGMEGFKAQTSLRWPDCQFNPFSLTDKEREELGIERRMPQSLKEAIGELKKCKALDVVLGQSLKEHYIAMKELDEREMSTWDEETRRHWYTKLF